MRLYTVHIRDEPDIVLVKEGFSWPGFVFSFLWAAASGLWWAALAIFAAALALAAVLDLVGAGDISRTIVQFGFHLLVGFSANDLRRWTLARAGYREGPVSTGADALEAERRYLDANLVPTKS
ncbi:MAG: DUF2628 domain-containing protein [Alphaproteobacteria bacterium]